MSYFETVIKPRIVTATHINHYPQFNRFEFVENEKILTTLYTEKSSQELAIKYNLNVHTLIRNRYYKFETKLKIIMEKLTAKQIIKICNNIIKKLELAKKNGTRIYLDLEIKKQISEIEYQELHDIKIQDHIVYFTLENATIMANADVNEFDNTLWWNGSEEYFDYDNRILFMNFIKECYENK